MIFIFRIVALSLVISFGSLTTAQTNTTEPLEAAPAPAPPNLTVFMSPVTRHFNPKPTHQHVSVIGLERQFADDTLDGAALFTNSFGQPTVYVYPWGQVYKSILGVDQLSFKWTGGVIYGYKGEFKDQVVNVMGFAPAIIPSLKYQFTPEWSAQVNLVGTAAAQLQINLALR